MSAIIQRETVGESLRYLSVEELVEDSMDILPRWGQDLPSRVSHGIRTPMTSIVGFEEILKEHPELSKEEKDEFIGIVREERGRLVRLVTCIRMFRQIRKNRLAIDVSFADARTAVSSACDAFRHSIKSRNIDFDVQAPAHAIGLLADHRQLQFAVELLIANALVVTHPGGRINVRVKKIAKGISIAVEDTGDGVRKDDLPFIFMPFTRVSHPDDSGSELGIGLTVARHIVSLHGGRIDAASIPSKGSRFRILLPS